jgi:tripartite-type tricarboxylate transporter receptor subunit TctC
MRIVHKTLLAAIGLIAAAPASAQLTEQPVRIVSPYAAGGVGDAIARLIAVPMHAALKRPVIVENKTGAAGRIGVRHVKDAAADGSVLLFTPIAPMSVFPHVYSDLGYDPAADFQPIAQIATFDIGVAVGRNVPAGSLAELVDWLRTHPEQAVYGSPAAGSLPHFFGTLFAQTAGLDFRHVPYKGNGAAIADLAGGHLPVFFTSTQDLVAMHREKLIRVLATSGAERSAALPEVPTFKEAGYAIRGDGWYGIYAPAKTQPEMIARLNKIVVDAVQSQEIRSRMTDLGLRPTGTSSDELAKIQRSDLQLWGPIVKASGFKPD